MSYGDTRGQPKVLTFEAKLVIYLTGGKFVLDRALGMPQMPTRFYRRSRNLVDLNFRIGM